MTGTLIATLVFLIVFGGAVLGMALRHYLPDGHLSADAKDVIKVAMAMIATLAALVLGLLTASAKASLDQKEGDVQSWAAEVILIDRTLAEYGPEAAHVRALIKETIALRVEEVWPGSGGGLKPSGLRSGHSEAVQEALLALEPQTDAQRWLKSTALTISQNLASSRWNAVQKLGSSIRYPFLAILTFWLAVIFTSFGLFAPRNWIVVSALCVAALSVAGSIFLIMEMDQPYGGLIKVSSAPMLNALSELGKP
jgi:hypothetical protein